MVLPSGTDEFSLRGGGEDQPELRRARSTSYRGHTVIVGRSSGSGLLQIRYDVVPAGAWTAPPPPGGGESRTDTVQRDSQMARPSSSVRVMPQTWMVRPTRIGIGRGGQVPVAQRAQVAGVDFDADDALAGPAARAAPKLAADSASRADTPPWRMP